MRSVPQLQHLRDKAERAKQRRGDTQVPRRRPTLKHKQTRTLTAYLYCSN